MALRAVIACATLVIACPLMAVADGEAETGDEPATADVPGGMFLPSPDGAAIWRQTLATISADWPVVRAVEPDFTAVPPRAGLIESAWVEPPGAAQPAWPPKRQRVVVRVEPFVVPKKSLTGDTTERVDTRVLQVIYEFDPAGRPPLFVGQQVEVFIDAAEANGAD